MLSIAVIGLGSRGTNYMRFLRLFCAKQANITAICDISEVKLKEVGDKYGIPENMRFNSEKAFFAEKRADAVWICTGDTLHYRQCMAALALGYHIMVEKPVSSNIEECLEIERTAKEKNLHVVVCHVLRYSNYYRKIKELLKSGTLGDIMTINHQENIAYYHFAHSYVRGNWHKKETSAPVLLAKCCHDIDIISWFMEGEAEDVQSYGSLNYFRKENAPQGAPQRCIEGCPDKACPYNAVNLYLKDPFYKAKFVKFMPRVLTGKNKNTKEDVLKALSCGDYGRCVFKSDNDVDDHQSLIMRFSGNRIATHTLSAFTDSFYRKTHITCTKGEIIGDDASGKLKVNYFGKRSKTIRTKLLPLPGHIEGDYKLVKAFVDLLAGNITNLSDLTLISATIASHRTIARAEATKK